MRKAWLDRAVMEKKGEENSRYVSRYFNETTFANALEQALSAFSKDVIAKTKAIDLLQKSGKSLLTRV